MKQVYTIVILLMIMFISDFKCNDETPVKIQEELILVLPTRNESIELKIYKAYVLVGQRLLEDNLISITPKMFANFATVVAYCESDFNSKSVKLDQQGIAQITKDTRSACNIPDQLDLSVEQQVEYHELFLRKCSIKALRSVKSSVDFHALNFAPSRIFQDTLSKVSNKWLAALDFTKDDIITRDDFRLFQNRRIKQSSIFMQSIYNQRG